MVELFFLFSKLEISGWGTNYEMIKCRTTGVSEFKITNFKIKDKLFHFFIHEFIFLILKMKLENLRNFFPLENDKTTEIL